MVSIENPPATAGGAGSVSKPPTYEYARVPAARASYWCHPAARITLQRAATPAAKPVFCRLARMIAPGFHTARSAIDS